MFKRTSPQRAGGGVANSSASTKMPSDGPSLSPSGRPHPSSPSVVVVDHHPVHPSSMTNVSPSGYALPGVNIAGVGASEKRSVVGQRPSDIAVLLHELDLTKYLAVFEEQDIDLQVFLTLTDSDLKQIGIELVHSI